MPPVTTIERGPSFDAGFMAAWTDLVDRAAEPNPFLEPHVLLPALRHLAPHRRVGLLTVRTGHRLEALMAVSWPVTVPIGHGVRVPLPLVETWVEPHRYLGTPLVDAARPVDALAALLHPPGSLPACALLLRYFVEGGPVAAALDEALAHRGQQALRTKTYDRALVVRGGPPMSRNRRNRHARLHRLRQTMAERLGPVHVVDRSADPSAVEDFLRLESAGWKGAARTALASRPADATWFRESCAGWRASGQLELLALEAGGRTVAMHVNVDAGSGSIHVKSAYDEAMSEFRPGDQLVGHLADAPDDRRAWRDSMTVPDNTLFNQLWPSRRTLSTVLVPLRRRTGRVALAAVRSVHERRRWASPSEVAGDDPSSTSTQGESERTTTS